MTRRMLVVALLLLVTFVYLARKVDGGAGALARATVAAAAAAWSLVRAEVDGSRSEDSEVLGVDDYARRTYAARASRWVGLYIGYYDSQRQGDTVHSPLNCLPGAGWTPVSQDRATRRVKDTAAAAANREITINRFVIQKGLDRQLVLYWYQSHGRVMASEYLGSHLHGDGRDPLQPYGCGAGARHRSRPW